MMFRLIAVAGSLLLMTAVGYRTVAQTSPTGETREAAAARVIELERSLWDSERRKDRQAMDALLAPGYQYFSSRGAQSRSKAEELDLQFSDRLRLVSFKLDHWHVAWLDDNALVLHYISEADVVFDQKSSHQLGGAMAAWVKRDGRWLAVARTEWKIAPENFLKPNPPIKPSPSPTP
jgi:hypothetical protein